MNLCLCGWAGRDFSVLSTPPLALHRRHHRCHRRRRFNHCYSRTTMLRSFLRVAASSYRSNVASPILQSRFRSTSAARFSDVSNLQKPIAFAFDIDGVLKAGPKVLPEAKRALQILEGNNPRNQKIPYIFITNGGGKHESARAKDLARELEVPVTEDQVIQAHTVDVECEVVVKMRLKRVWTLVVVKGWTDQSDTSAREDETEKRDSNVNAEGGTTMHDEWDRQWYQRLDVVSRKQGLNR